MPKKGSTRRTYSPELRAEAMRLYAERGPAETSRRLDIPVTTLTNWAKDAGVLAPVNERSKNLPAVQAAAAELERRTNELAAALADAELTDYEPEEFRRMFVIIAREAFARTRSSIAVGDDMAAKRYGDLLSQATDKLQLLSGRATSRREELTSPDDAASRLAAMFEAIRARQVPGLLDASSREVRRVVGDHVPELPGPAEVDDWDIPWPDAPEPRPEPGPESLESGD